jgi:hypothetical protein
MIGGSAALCGRRFTDESRSDHVNAMALTEAGGRAVLLWTQAVQTQVTRTAYVPGLPTVNRFDFASGRGARTAVASDASDASAVAASWGSPPLGHSRGTSPSTT